MRSKNVGEQLSSEQSWQGGRGTLQQNGGKVAEQCGCMQQ